MGKRHHRYVAIAEAGKGWRIWNRKARRWWGEAYLHYPEQLLEELNGAKRPEKLTELIQSAERNRA